MMWMEKARLELLVLIYCRYEFYGDVLAFRTFFDPYIREDF